MGGTNLLKKKRKGSVRQKHRYFLVIFFKNVAKGGGNKLEGRIKDHPILEFKRGKRVKFYFEDREIEAYEGETVAAALHAAGIRVLRHTSNMGRPAGLFCATGKCSSCLMEIDGVANVRSCMTKVKEDMKVRRQEGKGDVL